MYNAKITRENPALITILIDRSGSMADKIEFEGEAMPRSQAVELIVNRIIDELIFKCRRGDRHNSYFNIGVFGYHDSECYSMLDYVSETKNIFSVEELLSVDVPTKTSSKRRVLPNGEEVFIENRVHQWIKGSSGGATPTYHAFKQLYQIVKKWTGKHPAASHPIVLHITDGETTSVDDAVMIDAASRLKSIKTMGGEVILFNIHLSNSSKAAIFPLSKDEIEQDNRHGRLLYEMSSYMPESFHKDICKLKELEDSTLFSGVKAVACNCSVSDLAAILSVGTSTIR